MSEICFRFTFLTAIWNLKVMWNQDFDFTVIPQVKTLSNRVLVWDAVCSLTTTSLTLHWMVVVIWLSWLQNGRLLHLLVGSWPQSIKGLLHRLPEVFGLDKISNFFYGIVDNVLYFTIEHKEAGKKLAPSILVLISQAIKSTSTKLVGEKNNFNYPYI